jgi:transposase
MSRYVRGEHRGQLVMFPESIDDYIREDSVVYFIDRFVDALDLVGLGFKKAVPGNLGRCPYDPADMLKLYIYGYFNRIRSSRRLEKESQRNLELIWLLKRLTPDDKTICNFRHDNRKVMKGVFREFVRMCDDLDLVGKEIVGIDGSKFRAQNGKDRNFNSKKLSDKLARIDKNIEHYLAEMDEVDRSEPCERAIKKEEIDRKIEEYKKRRKEYENHLEHLQTSGHSQLSTVDPDSRLMQNKGSSDVCFNVQTAVDSKKKLIVEYEVTNHGNDVNLLYDMAKKTKDSLDVKTLTVLADKGYFNSNEIKKCKDDNITTYVSEKTNPGGKGGVPTLDFTRDKFVYDVKRDCFVCPLGNDLFYRSSETRNGSRSYIYECRSFNDCGCRGSCSTSKKAGRKVKRWEDEEHMTDLRQRLESDPDMIKNRKQLCEHPFGTLKRGMGYDHFLMRGIEKTTAEMGLSCLVYNMKRAINELGVEVLVDYVRKRIESSLKSMCNSVQIFYFGNFVANLLKTKKNQTDFCVLET